MKRSTFLFCLRAGTHAPDVLADDPERRNDLSTEFLHTRSLHRCRRLRRKSVSGRSRFATVVLMGVAVTSTACGDVRELSPLEPSRPTLPVAEPPPIGASSVTVDPSVVELTAVGQEIQLSAVARDASGAVLGGMPVSWSSLDSSVVTVDEHGLTTAQGQGETMVVAAVGDARGQSSLAVQFPPPQNRVPTAAILSPAAGSTFTQGQAITFLGQSSDPEEGSLVGSALEWTSDQDGRLGVGAEVTSPSLSVGSHSVTLRATDSGGLTTTASVAITVELPPPSVPALLLHSSLDDAASITSPDAGSGVGASVTTTPANDFKPAQLGNGLHADAVGERALFRQTDGVAQNVELDQGTMEFWYQPNYDHTSDVKYTIAGTGTWISGNQTVGSIHLGKHNLSNQASLFLIFFDANAKRWEHNVDAVSYGWSAGEWLLVRVTWDFETVAGERNLHLYIDGQELPLTGQVSTGPQVLPAESSTDTIYVGARDVAGGISAGGVYDEVRIWDGVVPPS